MMHERARNRRVKVTAEVMIEITDEAALEEAVLADIDETEFLAGEGSTAEKARAAERDEVRGDPTAAVGWIADSFSVVPELPGVEFLEGICTVEEVDANGSPLSPEPAFAELFPLCRCEMDSCDACSGFQLTPRTAAALWTAGQILVEQAYDDVMEHGDKPVLDSGEWALFGRYPRMTWAQDAVWRRQAARAHEDLTADLAAGDWPTPRYPAEEMALHLMLRDAGAAAKRSGTGPREAPTRLLENRDDLNWEPAYDVLFQDTDILGLFDPNLDGIEDPENELNQQLSIGDYRPQAWFKAFANMEPRDGRRPFHR